MKITGPKFSKGNGQQNCKLKLLCKVCSRVRNNQEIIIYNNLFLYMYISYSKGCFSFSRCYPYMGKKNYILFQLCPLVSSMQSFGGKMERICQFKPWFRYKSRRRRCYDLSRTQWKIYGNSFTNNIPVSFILV